MPKNKDLKRLTRSRMAKTGESYTTARAKLLEKQRSPAAAPTAPPLPVDYLTLAGMSDEAVAAKTGRSWPEWTALLDAEGATAWPHRQIADFVHGEHGVPGWWSQTVTVGYERIRGLRDVGQRRGGGYEASKSKTLPVPVAELYAAWSDARRQRRWLQGVKLVVRTASPSKSMRITWEDGSSVELYFTAKGKDKSQVVIQHRKLASKADAEAMRRFWTERLTALGAQLAASR